MKNDFRKMEDEMSKLDTTLNSVTEYSDKVNTALQDKRTQISQLSGVHTLLHKVTAEYIFLLSLSWYTVFGLVFLDPQLLQKKFYRKI